MVVTLGTLLKLHLEVQKHLMLHIPTYLRPHPPRNAFLIHIPKQVTRTRYMYAKTPTVPLSSLGSRPE